MKARVPILVMMALLALALFAPAAWPRTTMTTTARRPAPQLVPVRQPPALRTMMTMRPRCQGREIRPGRATSRRAVARIRRPRRPRCPAPQPVASDR